MKGLRMLTFSSLVVNVLLLVPVVILFNTNIEHASQDAKKKNSSILINFDQKDFGQINDLIARFHEGKGKTLMLIPPIIDGGYWIHDVSSNGNIVRWSIDNTRDAWSSERTIKTYSCQSIEKSENDTLFAVYLSNCEGYSPDEQIHAFSIRKD